MILKKKKIDKSKDNNDFDFSTIPKPIIEGNRLLDSNESSRSDVYHRGGIGIRMADSNYETAFSSPHDPIEYNKRKLIKSGLMNDFNPNAKTEEEIKKHNIVCSLILGVDMIK